MSYFYFCFITTQTLKNFNISLVFVQLLIFIWWFCKFYVVLQIKLNLQICYFMKMRTFYYFSDLLPKTNFICLFRIRTKKSTLHQVYKLHYYSKFEFGTIWNYRYFLVNSCYVLLIYQIFDWHVKHKVENSRYFLI